MKIFSRLVLSVIAICGVSLVGIETASAGGGKLPALTVAKGCTSPAKPGDIITCDITIQNTTKEDYWEVTVFDPNPPQLRVMSVSPGCSIKGNNPVCNFRSLNKWSTKNLWFKFQIDPNTPCNTTLMNQIDVGAKGAPTAWAKTQIHVQCKPKTQCSDGIDNDGDGWIDLDDCGCVSPEGDNEANTNSPKCKKPQCSDGIDNDGDGWVDLDDCGCESPNGDNEANTNSPKCKKPQCSDGIDNDGDGWIDLDDCGCVSPDGNNEANNHSPKCKVPQCRDGIDNDGDGWVDLDDSGCTSPDDDDESNPRKPQCSDGKDNDGDGWIDLDDSGCTSPHDDDESNPKPKPQCSDGKDNDGDGWIDLDDSGCTSPHDDDETNPKPKPQCSDGKDNDGDGWVDLDDSGCTGPDDDDESDPKPKPQCSDGKDNDGDGKIDFPNDPGCDSKDDNDEFNQHTSPVLPHLECVYDLGNGRYRAYFGYDNSGSTAVHIPAGSNSGEQVNTFHPTPLDRGQVSAFNPGRKVAAFSVDFDGSPITWKVKPAGGVLNSITASTASKACRPIVPIAECADKKPGGGRQILFGYQNDNNFEVAIEIGDHNKFTPAPIDRGQPDRFFKGRVKNAFSVTAQGDLAWILGLKEAWVNDATPACTTNTAPICNAGTSYESQCQGDQAKIFLDGSSSRDPDGTGITYKWSSDCPGAVISDASAAKPILTVNTSTGQAVSCNVSLKVSDGINESSCSQPVSIASCSKDCAGVPNGSAKVDQCGVCNGTNACLDCNGVPFGTARVDRCGVCGGNDSCVDCNGTPNGVAVLDDCGVCGGDGSSCRQCTTTDISNLLLALDIAANKLRNLCNKVGKRLASLPNASNKVKNAVTEARKQCEFFYQESWNTIWTQIPSKIVNCANATACAEVDISARTSSVTTLSSGIRDIVLELARQSQSLNKKANKPTTADKKAVQDANALHESTLSAIAQVPRFTSACN